MFLKQLFSCFSIIIIVLVIKRSCVMQVRKYVFISSSLEKLRSSDATETGKLGTMITLWKNLGNLKSSQAG